MKRIPLKMNHMLAFVFAGILAAGPAIADKPSRDDGDGDKHRQKNKQENRKAEQRGGDDRSRDHAESRVRRGEYFDDHRRTAAHDYYREQFRSGRCPPGLAKKRNGCMPPGQTRKWAVGRPLPRAGSFYGLPPRRGGWAAVAGATASIPVITDSRGPTSCGCDRGNH